MNKTDLRRHFRAARRAFVATLDKARREQLEQALAEVVAPALAGATMIGSYAAIGDEIDPVWVERRFGRHGFPRAFPRVNGPDIVFHAAEWRDLRPGFQGIAEPPATAPVVVPDVVLVPLVAVTLAGVRLGQGRGYYDRALARLRKDAMSQGPALLAIGLAWECQIAPALPADAWDMPLNRIATPQRLVTASDFR